jgi:hypothetical protein
LSYTQNLLLNIKGLIVKTNLLSGLILVCIVSLITACGGGSSGGTVPPPPPPTPPLSNFTPLNVEYTGLRTPFIITDVNIGETAISALTSLDFLNQLALGEDFKNSFTILQSSNTPAVSGNLFCSSGSNVRNTNTAGTEVEVNYNNCVVDGERLNGKTQSFIDTSTGAQIATINIDLTVVTVEDSSTLSLKGNIAVTANGNLRYALLLADEEGTIWFDNMIAFVDDVGLRVFFQGDMYVSNEGKLVISTNSIEYDDNESAYVADIDITGDRTINTNTVQGKRLAISGTSLAAIINLDLTNFAGLPDNNLPPQARASFETSALYNDLIIVDSTASSDPNIQVITYTWEVIEKVEGSDVSISPQSGSANITANRPGDYKIRMTASDPLGESDFVDIALRFNQRPPEVTFAFNSSEYQYKDLLKGKALVTSPNFDGPFSFSLEYSPEGMKIDETGNINWIVSLPNLGQTLQVNAGVRVTSPSHSTLVNASFEAIPEQSAKRIPINTHFDLDSKFALDTNSPILLVNRGAFDVSFDGLEMVLSPHLLPHSIRKYAASIMHIADIDEDGDLDYFTTLFAEETKTHYVFSLDAQGNRAFSYEFIKNDNDDFVLDLEILDLSDSPLREIALVDSNSRDFFRVLSNSAELLTSEGFLGAPWCDIDNNGTLDWKTDFLGYRLFDENQSTSFSSNAADIATRPRNRELSSECILYSYSIGENGRPANILELRPFANDEEDTEKVILNLVDLAAQYSISDYYTIVLTEINADNDSANELLLALIAFESELVLLIDNVGMTNQTVQTLPVNGDSPNFSNITGYNANIFDINNDGIDEFFTLTEQNFRGDYNLAATFIDSMAFTQFINTRTFSMFASYVKYWDGTRGVIDEQSDRLVSIDIDGDSASQTELIDNITYGSLITEEAGEQFFYSISNDQNNAGLVLTKYTLNGTVIYSSIVNSAEAITNTIVNELNENYLLLSTFNPVIVNRSNGTVVHRFGNRTQAVAANDNIYLMPSNNPQNVGYVLARNEENNILETVVLQANGTIKTVVFNGLFDLLNGYDDKVSLLQLNETPAFEFVLHIGSFENRQAFFVNFDAGTIEELEQSIRGDAGSPENSLTLLSPCIVQSQTCQNSIYGERRGISSFYGNIYASDIITGKTVWKTNQPFLDLSSVVIANDNGEYKTILITQKDWFMLK